MATRLRNIRFGKLEKELFYTVESHAWKRCKPRVDEFRRYLYRHNQLQTRKIQPDFGGLRFACAKVREALRPFRVQPIALIKSFWRLKKDTSAGLTLDDEGVFRKVYSTKFDVPFYSVKRDIMRWKKFGFIDNPSAITFRSHLARGEAHKTRVVFVYPYSVCSLEGKYAIPLLDSLKASPYSSPFGTQHRWLQGGFRHFKAVMRDGTPVSLDFSGFDLSVQRYYIEIAFRLLRECFSLSTSDEIEWQLFVEYFINTKVRADGEDLVLSGGVPSGSVWTHIVTSVISMLLAYYLVPDLNTVKAFGDDLVIMCKKAPVLESLVLSARRCGFDISLEKSVVGEIHWLGFDCTGSYPKILDLVKRWAGFFHPERPDETMAHHKGRLLGYAMSALGDPRFTEDFLTLWYELDRYDAIVIDSCLPPEFQLQSVTGLETLTRIFRNVL